MGLWEMVLAAVIASAITGAYVYLLGKWRARPQAAQWTLAQLNDETWTLRRDSSRTAFALHVYELGDDSRSPAVRLGEYLQRGDLQGGEEIPVVGIKLGTEVRLDWVERDSRLCARVLVRTGVTEAVITRRMVRRFVST